MYEPRQIFKNTAVLIAAKLIERGSNFFLIFFISRFLQATGLGIYSAAMAYYGLIAIAADMGSTNLLVRDIAREPAKTSRYVVHVAVMAATLGAAIMAFSFLILPYLGYSATMASSVGIVILAIIPGTLNTIQEAVFVARQRVEFQTYTTFVAAIVNISVSLYLLTNGYGIISLVVAFVVVKYLVTICYFIFINRFIAPLQWEFQLSFALSLFREMKTFAGLSILAGLFARPEIIILSVLRSEAQVGYYSAALKMVDLWYLLPQTFMINIFPVLSRSYHSLNQKSQLIQDKSIKYLLAMSLPLSIGLAVAAEPIIELIYGPGFEPASRVLQLLAWSLPLSCLNAVLWRVLAARNEQNLVLRVQVVSTFARLASGYALILIFGPLGAALTLVANMLLHNRLLSLYIKRDGTRLNPLRLGWRFALAAVGMGLLTLAISQQVQLWLLVPVAAAIYLILIVLFKAFSPDDLALFRRVLRPRKDPKGSQI